MRIAAIVLCSYFIFCLNTKALSVSAEDVLQNEDKAQKLAFLWQDESVTEALRIFQDSAIAWEILREPENSARCLREAAKLQIQFSKEEIAVRLLKKALLLDRNQNNLKGQADTFSLLTIVLTKLGKSKESGFYHQKALQLAERSGNRAQIAISFAASGNYYYGQRKFHEMLQQQEIALKIFRELNDQKSETEILIDLAYSYTINNDRIRGRDIALNAIDIAKSTGNLRGKVFGLIALGDAYQRMGESENALKTLLEAKQLFTPNIDLFEKAIIYNRLGHYFQSYNNLSEAKKLFRTSYDLFERANNIEGQSETLSVLGNICILENDLSQALNYFRQARQIAENSDDVMPLALINLRLGEVHLRLNGFSEANESLENSLYYYEYLGVQYRIAEVKEKLGLLFEKRKHFSKARNEYLDALKINRKIHSKFAQAQNYYYLARVDMLQGNLNSGISNIRESINLTELSNNGTSNSKLKRDFFSGVSDRYELYINFLMEMQKRLPDKDFAIQALQAAERSRSRSMLETLTLSEGNFSKDAKPETVEREKDIRRLLNLKSDNLTDLLSKEAEKSEIEELDNEINALEHELEDVKAGLKESSPIYSSIMNPEPFNVKLFQDEVLDEHSLLLEYSFGDKESYLWLVGKDEVLSFVLPARDQIESRIQKLRETLNSREMTSGEAIEDFQARKVTAEKAYWSEAHLLSEDLLGQISGKLEGKRLIIVPDGKLHYFPVSALPFPNSAKDEPILLTNETVYEPSAQTTMLLAKSRGNSRNSVKTLLVFADPIFSPDDSRLVSTPSTELGAVAEKDLKNSFRFADSLKDLHRLPASKNEGDSIADLLGASGNDVLSGFSATRENVLNPDLANYRVIHFATHGLVNEERPELSGIVLSGIDKSGQKLEQVVRLQDIYGMELNADLVVLSACNTGVGKDVKGEGLQSLNNAFLSVGAKTVVSSLWKVEDSATLELMKNFYGTLAEGKSTPSMALRNAQIKMWNNPRFKSPFYWAAFTVQGNFVHVPDVSNRSFFRNRSSLWLIGGGVVLGLLLLFFFFRKRSQSIRNA